MKSVRLAASLVCLLTTLTALAQTDARKAFDRLKTLDGTWEAKVNNKPVEVIFRTTSGGSAVLSEVMGEENMITMFHMDNDRVLATHYCAAGNQPRMQGSMSPDGKTITFTFVDGTNIAGRKVGHMDRLVITMPDADHHSQDWTFIQDGKEQVERFELARVKAPM